jgi:hypothetical protein
MHGKFCYKTDTSGALKVQIFRNQGTNTQQQVLYLLEKSRNENNCE